MNSTIPSKDINHIKLPIFRFSGQNLLRTHKTSYEKDRDILFFGKAETQRFNDCKNEFGVCYLGLDEHVCFIETFRTTEQSDGYNIISYKTLEQKSLATITVLNKISLVDLTSSGLAILGTTAEITTGEHKISQKWSNAFYYHPDKPDGIYYRARHDPSRFCIALYDRAQTNIKIEKTCLWANVSLLAEILGEYQFGLV